MADGDKPERQHQSMEGQTFHDEHGEPYQSTSTQPPLMARDSTTEHHPDDVPGLDRPAYSDFLLKLASKYSMPFPIGGQGEVPINSASYDPIFRLMHAELLGAIYPDGGFHVGGVVSAETFSNVMRHVLLGHIARENYNATGMFSPLRYPEYDAMLLPHSLFEIIHRVGPVSFNTGELSIIPVQTADDPIVAVPAVPGHQEFADVQRLILHARSRELIRTSSLQEPSTPTYYWCMSARSAADRRTAATINTSNVIVLRQFHDGSKEDVLLSALACNNVMLPLADHYPCHVWSSSVIGGVVQSRLSFLLNA